MSSGEHTDDEDDDLYSGISSRRTSTGNIADAVGNGSDSDDHGMYDDILGVTTARAPHHPQICSCFSRSCVPS